jgi:hypothetical protein
MIPNSVRSFLSLIGHALCHTEVYLGWKILPLPSSGDIVMNMTCQAFRSQGRRQNIGHNISQLRTAPFATHLGMGSSKACPIAIPSHLSSRLPSASLRGGA